MIRGDSGGPIICQNNKVAGILTRGGDPCDNPSTPNLFTNIGIYRNWIDMMLLMN